MTFEDDFEDDFEDWEADANLYDEEDWIGLLNLREERAKKQPSDLYAQERYAEALIFNKKYKEALDFLTPLYRKNYDSGFGICEILDALFRLGKNEDDFAWIEKPDVLKLDKNTLDFCLELLKGKRKHVSLFQLYSDLLMHADYLKFNEKELSEFLVNYTEVFDFIGDKTDFFDLKIKLNKQKK